MGVCKMGKNLSSFERQLCDIQGRLFERALDKGYDSLSFISHFMQSETAKMLDRSYDRLQWSGEEYMLLNLEEEVGSMEKTGDLFDKETMYWIGYLYRYWHYFTGESSMQIYSQADGKLMEESYLGFHTLDNAMAVEELKELCRQKREERKNVNN